MKETEETGEQSDSDGNSNSDSDGNCDGSNSVSDGDSDSDSDSDGKKKREPQRRTLAGKVIGYTGMDPPSPFEMLINPDPNPNPNPNPKNNTDDMSAVDLEMLEFQRIKSLKRKKGTLKKNHKPAALSPTPVDKDEIEKEELDEGGSMP
jgi:hypothetical protein